MAHQAGEDVAGPPVLGGHAQGAVGEVRARQLRFGHGGHGDVAGGRQGLAVAEPTDEEVRGVETLGQAGDGGGLVGVELLRRRGEDVEGGGLGVALCKGEGSRLRSKSSLFNFLFFFPNLRWDRKAFSSFF